MRRCCCDCRGELYAESSQNHAEPLTVPAARLVPSSVVRLGSACTYYTLGTVSRFGLSRGNFGGRPHKFTVAAAGIRTNARQLFNATLDGNHDSRRNFKQENICARTDARHTNQAAGGDMEACTSNFVP